MSERLFASTENGSIQQHRKQRRMTMITNSVYDKQLSLLGFGAMRLPVKSDVSEIFGASPSRKGVTAITEKLKLGETRVWRMSVK